MKEREIQWSLYKEIYVEKRVDIEINICEESGEYKM